MWWDRLSVHEASTGPRPRTHSARRRTHYAQWLRSSHLRTPIGRRWLRWPRERLLFSVRTPLIYRSPHFGARNQHRRKIRYGDWSPRPTRTRAVQKSWTPRPRRPHARGGSLRPNALAPRTLAALALLWADFPGPSRLFASAHASSVWPRTPSISFTLSVLFWRLLLHF